MNDEIKEFRDGIFALRTRRFGTVAELMIEALYSFTKSHNQFHDRYDEVGHQRIEIKFSTVMKANEAVINRSNAIDQCKKANLGNRALNSTEMYEYDFDCNIQQVKRLEFDVLYYGLFFADRIRFLYKGIIIKHNKTEPTYTKTSLFLCEKRRFFMARTEKGVVTTI